MRCDPSGPLLARVVFCAFFGWVALETATSFKPWAPDTDWYGILFAFAILAAGLWGVVGYVGSSLTIDHADGQLILSRFDLWAQTTEPRPIRLDQIEAVVLTPQSRPQLLLPKRIELRLKGGDKVVISTLCTFLPGMAEYGQELATEIGCPYEEQEKPDEVRSR